MPHNKVLRPTNPPLACLRHVVRAIERLLLAPTRLPQQAQISPKQTFTFSDGP